MDQREELARLIRETRPRSELADVILAAGWEKRSPAGEAGQGLLERVRSSAEGWRREDALDHRDPVDEAAFMDEIASALSTRPAGESVGVAEFTKTELRLLACWAASEPGGKSAAIYGVSNAAKRLVSVARASQPSAGEVE